jgi:tetratricopeptide (TPR) repeat protein
MHLTLAEVYVAQKRFDDAIREVMRVRQLVGEDDPYGLGELGYAYAVAGRWVEAKQVLDRIMKFTAKGFDLSVQIAYIEIALGDKEQTLIWLEKAFRLRNSELAYLKIDPAWAPIHADPRYTALLKKIGLDK